jgi:hypothetical protein
MTDAIGSEGEVRLARVSYLPGVQPPPEPSAQPDLPPKRLHNFPTGELERLTPQQLQERMNEITKRDEPEAEEPETDGERSARAHNVSMYALTRKGLSSAEMTDLLRSRDLEAGDVAFEVTRLERVGLLNDRELAERRLRLRRRRRANPSSGDRAQAGATASLARRRNRTTQARGVPHAQGILGQRRRVSRSFRARTAEQVRRRSTLSLAL